MNLVLPEGARKLGGRRGCSRRGTFVHALLCSTALLTFVSKYSDFFLHMTQHVMGEGGGGGGGQLLPEGWHFICHGGGGGSCPPPTRKAMLDPGLHGIYLDLS